MSNCMPKEYMSNIIKNNYELKGLNENERKNFNYKITNRVWFSDEIWDFTEFNESNRINENYKYNFTSIPINYVFYLKLLLLNDLMVVKNSFGSVRKIYSCIKTLSKKFYKKGITDVRIIDKDIVAEIFDDYVNKNKDSYVESLARTLSEYLKIVEEYEHLGLRESIDYLYKLANDTLGHRRITSVNNYIPDVFLNQIVSFAIKDLDNKGISKDKRIVTGLIVLMAETGMRVEEASLLETNMLESSEVLENTIHYLKFYTFKTHSANSEKKLTKTFLTPIALKAYTQCVKLANEIIDGLSKKTKLKLMVTILKKEYISRKVTINQLRDIINNLSLENRFEIEKEMRRYIFICERTGKQKNGGSFLRQNTERFFIRNADKFDLKNMPTKDRDKIKKLGITSNSKYEKYFTDEQRKTISFEEIKNREYPYINPHMYRVTLCTKLFMQGVHIDYIIKHLNHLSEDMTCYYNKSEEFNDSLVSTMNVFSRISNDQGMIETDCEKVNDKTLKEELKKEDFRYSLEKINEFLDKNKLNIRNDLDKIVKLMGKANSPIMENELGICVTSVIQRICDKRKYFSSLEDNYFISFELPTYKFINYSYERFKQKESIVAHNQEIAKKEERYKNEFEREVKALKYFVNKTLKQEIMYLENDIELQGIEEVIQRNKQLESIIVNLNVIKEEINRWIN